MKGLVVFSFALGAEEPNPCNRRLSQEAIRIIKAENDDVVLVAQFETSLAMSDPSKNLSEGRVVVGHRYPGQYLDSDEVMAQAAEIFKEFGINEVIVVAQPFLHLSLCRRLAQQYGFTVLKRKIGWIGFYRQSLQWWTRDPVRLLFYAAMRKITGRRGS